METGKQRLTIYCDVMSGNIKRDNAQDIQKRQQQDEVNDAQPPRASHINRI